MIDPSSLITGLTFYRQARMDGGIRTGIMVGASTVLGCYESGPDRDDHDPALVWSVDLRCRGNDLPDDPEEAKSWMLDREAIIRDGFARYAAQLSAGVDVEPYPLQWSGFVGLPESIDMEIARTALRRVDALALSNVLRDLGDQWDARIKSLVPIGSASSWAG